MADDWAIVTRFSLPQPARHGVEATVAPSFGAEPLPEGLVAVVGNRVGDR